MESHVPGDPTIIVENMPGAGHLIGWNYVTNAAPKDGTVMGNANGSLVLQQLIGADGVEFDMTNIHYLGMPDAPVNMVLVARADAGITDVEQLIDGGTDPLVIGTSAAGDIVQDAATLLKEVVGANVDIVSGYGGDAIVLALEQGETDGWFTSTATLTAKFQDKVDSGEWVVLVQTAEEAEAGFEDVPTLLELVDSDEDRQLILTGAAGRGYVRPYFLPDGVPEERVDALRTAFEATMEDPEFIADMEKAGRMVELVTGDELKDIYTSYIEDTTQEQAAKLKKILGL
jgi:tripartite-type tricarboxylate transporter receptor subunit TctC